MSRMLGANAPYFFLGACIAVLWSSIANIHDPSTRGCPRPPRGLDTPPVDFPLALRVKLTLWVLMVIVASSWLGANAPYFFLWSCIAVVWLTPW